MHKSIIIIFLWWYCASSSIMCQTTHDSSMYYAVPPIENPMMFEYPIFVKRFPIDQIIKDLNKTVDTLLLCAQHYSPLEVVTFVAYKKKQWSGFKIIEKVIVDGDGLHDNTLHCWIVCNTTHIVAPDSIPLDSLFEQSMIEVGKTLFFSKLLCSTYRNTYVYIYNGKEELYQEIIGGMKSLEFNMESIHKMAVYFDNVFSSEESYTLKQRITSAFF